MKKTLLIGLIILLLGGAVFALSFEAHVSVSPYSFKRLNVKKGTSRDSDSGFGAKAAIRHNFFILMYSGLEAGYNQYKFKAIPDEQICKDFSAYYKIGVVFPEVSKIQAEANVGVGVGRRDFLGEVKWNPLAAFYLGLRYKFNSVLKLTVGADFRGEYNDIDENFRFEDLSLQHMAINPLVGISIGF